MRVRFVRFDLSFVNVLARLHNNGLISYKKLLKATGHRLKSGFFGKRKKPGNLIREGFLLSFNKNPGFGSASKDQND